MSEDIQNFESFSIIIFFKKLFKINEEIPNEMNPDKMIAPMKLTKFITGRTTPLFHPFKKNIKAENTIGASKIKFSIKIFIIHLSAIF